MSNKYPLVLTINNYEDIKLLQNNTITEYINIGINNLDDRVISYFREHGQNYYYSDCINNSCGYVYVSYDTFIKGQDIIDTIILAMPNDLNEIEKCRYLYKSIGRIITYDINVLSDKNDNFNFNKLNTINNIWGCLSNLKGTNISLTKLFFYLCKQFNIDNEIIRMNDFGYLANKININGSVFITDITKDIPFIQAKFQTRYFGDYNDDIEMDKRIKYIKSLYNDSVLSNKLKKLNYNEDNILESILEIVENVISVKDMGPIELGVILDSIFKKYCPSNHIVINNLYTVDIHNNREHFILISDKDNYYSYNYRQNKFLSIGITDLERSIISNKIGVYLDEIIPNINIKRNGEVM